MSAAARTTRPRTWLPAAALAAALALTGCGEQESQPLEEDGPEVQGGAVGPQEDVGPDIQLVGVQLEYPEDGLYEVGEEADLFVGITNNESEGDTLVDVVSPAFTEAVFMIDGAEVEAIPIPENDNVYVGAEDSPTITLVGLQEDLRSSQSIPVTFVFDQAGEETIDAMVSASPQTPAAPYDFPNPDEDPTSSN